MTLIFLNSLGTGEVFFILLVILLLFGSKSIPSMAKGLGKGMREIQNASNEIKRDIQNSVLEMKREVNMSEALQKSIEENDTPKKTEQEEIKNSEVTEVKESEENRSEA